jgi:hypothetical protein
MIKVVKTGSYKLIETKEQTKILILDAKDTFAWVNLEGIGEILVTSHKTHKADTVLSVGHYRLYDVEDEPKLSDQLHLELSVGEGIWQDKKVDGSLENTVRKLKEKLLTT